MRNIYSDIWSNKGKHDLQFLCASVSLKGTQKPECRIQLIICCACFFLSCKTRTVLQKKATKVALPFEKTAGVSLRHTASHLTHTATLLLKLTTTHLTYSATWILKLTTNAIDLHCNLLLKLTTSHLTHSTTWLLKLTTTHLTHIATWLLNPITHHRTHSTTWLLKLTTTHLTHGTRGTLKYFYVTEMRKRNDSLKRTDCITIQNGLIRTT